eukprot:SAG11_NODE_1172_length_5611_cov_2.962990_3_plen_229_part_00
MSARRARTAAPARIWRAASPGQAFLAVRRCHRLRHRGATPRARPSPHASTTPGCRRRGCRASRTASTARCASTPGNSPRRRCRSGATSAAPMTLSSCMRAILPLHRRSIATKCPPSPPRAVASSSSSMRRPLILGATAPRPSRSARSRRQWPRRLEPAPRPFCSRRENITRLASSSPPHTRTSRFRTWRGVRSSSPARCLSQTPKQSGQSTTKRPHVETRHQRPDSAH